jgi:hypothetical protein
MLVSASVRTDIPAFYGAWFRNRLEAGYCRYVNPYNAAQQPRVSLRPADVDGFVFWTKNLTPFLPVLEEVKARAMPFMVQYTINGYPRALESRVVDADASVRTLRHVAERYHPRVAVWRYDTIVFSSLTPFAWHVDNFGRLAEQLRGATDEVVISFVQAYKKTRTNIAAAEREQGFEFHDVGEDAKQALLVQLEAITKANSMAINLCSQPELQVPGVGIAHCVDKSRMEELGGGRTIAAKIDGTRPNCECYKSRDIGDYDTCPHGCVYCYAVQNRALALRRYKAHNPYSDFLFEPATVTPLPEPAAPGKEQLGLFSDS